MQFCVLGSGSSGNSSVVACAAGALLIDAGFGPRTVARRLEGTGVTLRQVRALLLTHLDGDHFKPPWFSELVRRRIALWCRHDHLDALRALASRNGGARDLEASGILHAFEEEPFTIPLGTSEIHVRPISLPHDAEGSVGFRLEASDGTLTYASDLGHVPDHLTEAMADADLIALESNHDPEMERASARHEALKQRVLGDRGHLSNEQAFAAIRTAAARSRRPPRHIILLHLSRTCNDPKLIRQLYRTEPHLHERLHLTSQHAPTPWLHARKGAAPVQGEQQALWEEA